MRVKENRVVLMRVNRTGVVLMGVNWIGVAFKRGKGTELS
jgi:hypothetical protein